MALMMMAEALAGIDYAPGPPMPKVGSARMRPASMPNRSFAASAPKFDLPAELEASEPAEAHGLARDEVRLMVSREGSDVIDHVRFVDLARFLRCGDLLVVNTSGTRNAAVDAVAPDGRDVVVHLSTRLPDGRWSVEVRQPAAGVASARFTSTSRGATLPFTTASIGEEYLLPLGGCVRLEAPYSPPAMGAVRLWVASVHLPGGVDAYLEANGRPIRYKYVRQDWPSEYYQTTFSTDRGSAEMPSAGRAFTERVLQDVRAKGVGIAPILLHTGVASLESHEPPYAEYYEVSQATADAVNRTHRDGGRVIAVGTTVVRALETVSDAAGVVHEGLGWTEVVVTPERGTSAVDGLITGLHEPEASHLQMLMAIASSRQLTNAYREALNEGYLWHEFGDLHLIFGDE